MIAAVMEWRRAHASEQKHRAIVRMCERRAKSPEYAARLKMGIAKIARELEYGNFDLAHMARVLIPFGTARNVWGRP